MCVVVAVASSSKELDVLFLLIAKLSCHINILFFFM